MFKRPYFDTIFTRLREPRQFIQVLAGPRQSGKTTLIHQVILAIDIPSLYASADAAIPASTTWIEQQWENARLRLKTDSSGRGIILVLDEMQKIDRWSETIKRLWDEDTMAGRDIKLVLLGSAPLLIRRGLTETLTGRFEMIRIPHWSYIEMRDAFGFTIDQYVYFGGYPGSSPLIGDEERWKSYIRDSLVETTISRDILMMTRIDKPALLKSLFEIGCEYSGSILSFNKMLGQLQDAGNTVTLSHYLELLDSAGMLAGLRKFSTRQLSKRSSSPKLQVLNTALVSAYLPGAFGRVRNDFERWGRLVESSVGAHLCNITRGSETRLYYWRDGEFEVDFVLARGEEIVGIEVKAGGRKEPLPGLKIFAKNFPVKKSLLVGTGGIALVEFFGYSLEDIMG
ncbi:MAG: ATP-binding protein [Spirochaetales bacterium]|nr:MAG: ATP-binding protein [Spirochaetales bacterium]